MSVNRRKKKLVNLSVQGAVAVRIVTHAILFVWSVLLVCGGLLYLLGPAETNGNLTHVRTICFMAIGLSTVVILPAIIYDSIKFSHRMAGPVVRLKHLLPRIGAERVEYVELRKQDFWQDFAVEFNAMLDRVEVLRQSARVTPAKTASAAKDEGIAPGAALGSQA